MSESRYVYVEVLEIQRETDEAFLCEFEDGEHWIPKSLIDDPDEFAEGDCDVEIGIARWLAVKKEIPFDDA